MIPEFSPRAKAALDIFFDGHNDVHFYVEDSGQQNAYHSILARLFPKLSIKQIFPLDGKPNVIRHARDTQGNSALQKPRVYIVDKDFDDIMGAMESLPGLFYLKKYSIENYLLEEDAILDFVLELSPKTEREKLRVDLQCPKLVESMLTDSEPLARLFFVVQKFDLGLPNTKAPPERFVESVRCPRIDTTKVAAYRREVFRALRSRGHVACDAELDVACASAFGRRLAGQHVSGKFLMRLLRLFLVANRYVGNVDMDVMFYSLARNSDKRPFRELGTRVRRYLQTLSESAHQSKAPS